MAFRRTYHGVSYLPHPRKRDSRLMWASAVGAAVLVEVSQGLR